MVSRIRSGFPPLTGVRAEESKEVGGVLPKLLPGPVADAMIFGIGIELDDRHSGRESLAVQVRVLRPEMIGHDDLNSPLK